MLSRIQSRIGRALAEMVRPHLERSQGQGRKRTVLTPVVTAQCMAHHYLVESLLRSAASDPENSKLLMELAREALERCNFELYGKEARVAAGIIEDLMARMEPSAAP
jgi:hypothetical protein